ncbi:MAG TPA: DUF2071 domain-containing protein [Candidatus Acidoferrum sp.]|nr:DUF2071 domain-containing protein [Candidatus Acidoferrum sp.]
MNSLEETAHRSWPLPRAAWIIRMMWEDLLFAHWPIPAAVLRPLVPSSLELDTFDGSAWLGIVPFRMTGVRLRGLPPVPGTSAFPELNVRTYVSAQGKPGVWFFSLDAASRIAVRAARAWFHLPYFDARMDSRGNGEEIAYSSVRIHRGAPTADFAARYRQTGEIQRAANGSLEHFLTERYCLYAGDTTNAGDPRLLRGEIHHSPWPLQPAEAEITVNTMTAPLGFRFPDTPPLLHFARRLDVVAWPPRPM